MSMGITPFTLHICPEAEFNTFRQVLVPANQQLFLGNKYVHCAFWSSDGILPTQYTFAGQNRLEILIESNCLRRIFDSNREFTLSLSAEPIQYRFIHSTTSTANKNGVYFVSHLERIRKIIINVFQLKRSPIECSGLSGTRL